MSEQLTYHSLKDLRRMSPEKLAALWDLVPTERQRAYKAAYEREVQTAGAAGSDVLELQVARELLRRYEESGLVPVGNRWARPPGRVQEAARANELLDDPDEQTAVNNRPSRKMMALIAVAGLVFVAIFLGRMGQSPEPESETIAAEATYTATPAITPTATPLVFDDPDTIITGGDPSRTAAYPVQLKIIPPQAEPRVWVVQRRAVRAAEWRFDPNPDTASFVNGMSVRPVIGIPWSDENAAFFADFGAGTDFVLTMNTGAVLRFTFSEAQTVRRTDTDIFRQIAPGLVVALIGETGADGLPTSTRALITADYPPEQELSRDDAVSISPTPAPEAVSGGLHAELIEVYTSGDILTTRLRLYNGGTEALTFTPDDVWLATGYSENPLGPRVPAEGMQAFTLLPEQAADVTLVWAWGGEPHATLGVRGWWFGVHVQ